MKTPAVPYTTRPFMSGRSQAIRIPRDFRLSDEDIIINKVGETLMITPKSKISETVMAGLHMLTEDFMKGGRPEETNNERIIL